MQKLTMTKNVYRTAAACVAIMVYAARGADETWRDGFEQGLGRW